MAVGDRLADCSARPKIQANLSLQTIMELTVDQMCSSWKSLTIAAHQEGGRTSMWPYRDLLSSDVQRMCLKGCREQRRASRDGRRPRDMPAGGRQSQAAPRQPREQAGRLGRRSVFVLWTCVGRENTEGQNKGAARDHGHSLICSHSQIFLEHLLHTGLSFKYRGYHRGQNESVCPHNCGARILGGK